MKKFVLLFSILILLSGCSIPSKKEYCCNDGGILREDGKCEKEKIMTTDITYTCPNGYVARGEVCYLDGKRRTFATQSYSCPYGGTVINGKCRMYYTYDPIECGEETSTKTVIDTKIDEIEVKEESATQS